MYLFFFLDQIILFVKQIDSSPSSLFFSLILDLVSLFVLFFVSFEGNFHEINITVVVFIAKSTQSRRTYQIEKRQLQGRGSYAPIHSPPQVNLMTFS